MQKIPDISEEEIQNVHFSMWDTVTPPRESGFDKIPVLTTMLHAVAGGNHEKMLEGARLIELAVKHGYEMAQAKQHMPVYPATPVSITLGDGREYGIDENGQQYVARRQRGQIIDFITIGRATRRQLDLNLLHMGHMRVHMEDE